MLRFISRELIYQYTLLHFAKWLVLGTLNIIVGFTEREICQDRERRTFRRTKILMFAPVHFLFVVTLVMSYIPGIGAYCSSFAGFPVIFLLLEFPFLVTIVMIWVLHCKNWLIEWKLDQMPEREKNVMQLFR